MTLLKDVRQRYYALTTKASEAVRTSAIAGLAAVWLFSGSSTGLSRLATAPDSLMLAGGLFALSLAFDILHYFAGGWTWRIYVRGQERKGKHDEDDLTWPRWIPAIPEILYTMKTVCLFVGYAILGGVLVNAAF
jgi:hypothetical protein